MTSRIARWRDAYWRTLIARYGKDNKTCQRIRTLCLWNGAILAVGGMLVSFMMCCADPIPPVPRPGVLERIIFGLPTLLIMSGSGLAAIYFGRWTGHEDP